MLKLTRGILVAVCALALPAQAATVLEAISASPDTTAVFGGLEVRDHEVFVDDLQGMLAPIAIGPLPESAAIDALHDFMDGSLLFSLESWADLGGLIVAPSDVVLWDGSSHSLAFEAAAAAVPAGANVDAVSVDGDDLLLSFDVPLDLAGVPYFDGDLVRWDGSAFSIALSGAAAGTPPGVGIDAAQQLDGGNLLLSFDGAGLAGGVAFADEDILEYDPASGDWEMAYDGSAEHSGWVSADLDALAAGVPPEILEIPTLSPGALVLLALALAAAGLTIRRRSLALSEDAHRGAHHS